MAHRVAASTFVSLTILIAGHAIAQPANAPRDPKAIVLDMLLSPDPKQQAWGAWYAGRDNMTDLVPAITGVVAQHHQTGASFEEHAATAIALDALIQLRATVAPDLIASLMETRPTHALILASNHIDRDGDKDDDGEDANADSVSQALLALMLQDQPAPRSSAPWFAAANLLLDRRRPPPGFGRALVTDTRIRIMVFVADTGNSGLRGGWAEGMGIGCHLHGSWSTGLPPWAVYDLTRLAHRGVVVLAMGPVPVYYRRVLTTSGQLSSVRSDYGPSLSERLQYVAKLAHLDKEALPVRDHESRDLKWEGAAALATSLQQIRADVQRRFALLLDQMIAAKVLERGEAASIAPTIELDVNDLRSDKSSALGSP